MPAREHVIKVVREWVEKADNDLANAVHTLKLGERGPTDTVCFHAQQCAEKYMKAVLVFQLIDFPKSHDLEKLTALLPATTRPSLSTEELHKLTDFATGPRYPGSGVIPLAEARLAVALARRVRKEMRAFLPKDALRRRKS